MLIYDIETDGFLEVLTKIHCLVIKDLSNGVVIRYNDQPGTPPQRSVRTGMRRLMKATEDGTPICGHNVIKFDNPAFKKVYPEFKVDERHVLDTLVLTRLIWPDLFDLDTKLKNRGQLPPKFFKRHSLEAWGYRLGNYKGDFAGPWDTWTQEMEDYCEQDVHVTSTLYEKCLERQFSEESIQLEHHTQRILLRQEQHGFLFDEAGAVKLYATLVRRREELRGDLTRLFPPFYQAGKEFTPKRDNIKSGYVAGAPFTKVALTTFNPGSRDHVAIVLKRKYGWVPTEFTSDGKPKVDETVLGKLEYPEAKVLNESFLIDKRIGQLAEGDEAWLKKVQPDGRIHGYVVTNGAVTGRMSHHGPNIGQVPATRSAYGHEMRALFTVPKGKVLVGCDADGIEGRTLAGYMAKFDGGVYVKVVLTGSKKDGTDPHSVNARALNLDPTGLVFVGIDDNDKSTGRDVAKTWFYAFLYGAGNEKLGALLLKRLGRLAMKKGKELRESFLANLPALNSLINKVKKRAQERGYLIGLDGRKLRVRSAHSALNTLLQSAGAIIMKRALCILDDDLQAAGLIPGVNYEFVANVHDEWQIEVDEDKGELVGKMAADAIRKAGEYYDFQCPMAGSYNIGKTWADTH